MGNKSSKTKILVISAVCLIVVIVALVIVIVCINKDNESNTNSVNTVTSDTIDDTNTDADNNSNPEITKSVIEDGPDDITSSLASDPSPTESAKETVSVTLGEYKGIKVNYSPVIITDEDIDNRLNSLKSEYTYAVDMPDRPFENGDIAIVTYRGIADNMVIDDLYVVGLQVVLGKGYMPENFENEIIGRKIGDTFTLDIDYPEDSNVIEAAGKTVHFDVELEDGFIFEIPEINDEFINEVTEYSTVEEYRTSTKEEMQKEQNDIAYDNAIHDLKTRITDNCIYSESINDEIKKEYVLRLNSENAQYQDAYMMDAATFYEYYYGIPASEYSSMLMDEVTMSVKFTYALDEIIKAEGIDKANPNADRIKLRELAEQFVIDSAIIDGLDK